MSLHVGLSAPSACFAQEDPHIYADIYTHTHACAHILSIGCPLTACQCVMDCSSGSACNIIFSVPPDPTPICHNCHLFPAWSHAIRWLFALKAPQSCQDDEQTHTYTRKHRPCINMWHSICSCLLIQSTLKRMSDGHAEVWPAGLVMFSAFEYITLTRIQSSASSGSQRQVQHI